MGWKEGKPRNEGLYLVCARNAMNKVFYMVDYWWSDKQHWSISKQVLAYMKFPFYDDKNKHR